MSAFSDDLALAHQLADLADAVTMPRFGAADLDVEAKPDLTPVSDADLACERELRALLSEERPDDEVLGEEFGGDATFEGRQWVIDPIDGTKNFVRGVPVWATLIALLVDGVPVVGVVSAPALGRRWWAAKDGGAWTSVAVGSPATSEARAESPGAPAPKRITVSRVGDVADCSVAISSLTGWRDRGLRDQLISLTDDAWRLRGYGDFFSYCLVAEGAVDVAAEPEVSLWDLAPLAVLVAEAGGRFTSLAGEDGPHGGDAVATNGLLHDAVLGYLR
ncbi:inositol monophosphatase family protein [Corynebacterium sp. HMSC11E11]|uniref:inositol monophosphatase family protein n=1 Tax=Corynebacterium sp. HMSC11E11 TaxID=1581089 RepID=UPI0008A5A180|nr:inositol monophosphatase family protein [Corynebacterium sp. HMSC11E11]OFU52839.1 histidinol-phosphatase [Corynebacterium sp. HMSC11E11]